MKRPANIHVARQQRLDLKQPLILVLMIVVLVAINACGTSPNRPHPQYAPTAALPVLPSKPVDGRIYQAERFVGLFQDLKARRAGDILTVELVENTSGQKSADTNVQKSSGNSVSAPTLGLRTHNDMGVAMESEHDFSGQGSSNQSNRLNGTIAVMVMEVLPGGNLVVQGEKWISINQGDEHVRVRGIVRPADISTSNSIPSTKIADARISYGANGAVADANAIGLLSRFFISKLWPF